MRVTHTRFTVTAGAVVLNTEGRVLLLKHRFRVGSGWGIPGGFVEAEEDPAEAMKRELCEEVGLEVEAIEIITARTLASVRHIEILFLCHAKGDAKPRSGEIRKAAWFSLSELPAGLPEDQKLLLRKTLVNGADRLD